MQPRKRSNSLPIPKIEVSIYQSPEMKKKESRVLVDYSDDSSHGSENGTKLLNLQLDYLGGTTKKQNLSDESPNMSRRSSEKVKKRTKIGDLRAFVETKLMSKSERTLEKIGQDDGKLSGIFDQVSLKFSSYAFCLAPLPRRVHNY
jgi:protein unc-80